MAGLIIYGNYGQFYSFIIADDILYKKTIADLKTQPSVKLCFDKGDLTLQQIENSRKTKDNIVKRLNAGKEVDVEKELSDYFN